ncbi:MAG: hypothetical protein ACYTFQ_33300 [Planctomycetota bacterium]|jgi:hypothetical protein
MRRYLLGSLLVVAAVALTVAATVKGSRFGVEWAAVDPRGEIAVVLGVKPGLEAKDVQAIFAGCRYRMEERVDVIQWLVLVDGVEYTEADYFAGDAPELCRVKVIRGYAAVGECPVL